MTMLPNASQGSKLLFLEMTMVKMNEEPNTSRTKRTVTIALYRLRKFQVLRKSSALIQVALIINILTVRAMVYESHKVDLQLHILLNALQRGRKN